MVAVAAIDEVCIKVHYGKPCRKLSGRLRKYLMHAQNYCTAGLDARRHIQVVQWYHISYGNQIDMQVNVDC